MEYSVLNAAEQKNDTELLTRIRRYDLFSCEAQYHISCRKQYVNTSVHWRSSSLEAKTKQSEMEMAHQAAFNGVCVSVDKALIAKQGVCKMTDLLQLYVSYLQESPFPNPNFRSEKLKVKLMNAYPKSLRRQEHVLRKEMGAKTLPVLVSVNGLCDMKSGEDLRKRRL